MKLRFALLVSAALLAPSCTRSSVALATSRSLLPPHTAYLRLQADGSNQATSLQQAIDSCAAAGGGTLVLRPGTYTSGPIYVGSAVTLQLDSLATLLASPVMSDFVVGGKVLNLLNSPAGTGLHDVALTGAGTIDGNGAA